MVRMTERQVEQFLKRTGQTPLAQVAVPKQKARKVKEHPSVARINVLLAPYGWQCDLYRCLSLDERSPHNHAMTCAAMNAIIAWTVARVCHIGFLWEVEAMSDGEIVAKVVGKEQVA